MTLQAIMDKYAGRFEFHTPRAGRLVVSCKIHEKVHRRVYEDSSGIWGEAITSHIDQDIDNHLGDE